MFFGPSPRKILTYENLQQPTTTYYSLKIFPVIVEADVKILWAGDCKSLTGICPKPSAPNRSYPKLSEVFVFFGPVVVVTSPLRLRKKFKPIKGY